MCCIHSRLQFFLFSISAKKIPEIGDGGNPDHDYIEELKNMIQGFKKASYNNYDAMVWELDALKAREAASSMSDIEKEVFSCDMRVAKKWVKQSKKQK